MKIFEKYLIRMISFLILLTLFSFLYFEKINIFFSTNTILNTVIIIILFFGIIFLFRQIFMFIPEIKWINSLIDNKKKISTRPPLLLKPLSELLKKQTGKLSLSQVGAKTILESLEVRLIEKRELSRYLIGLLIFLGLLGTFWGLLETIQSVSETVASLDFSQESDELFILLKDGLQKPLSGMGTAFSSSLFGLGGSLILGFFDLQAAQSQNRFYNEIEEKLAIVTKISSTTNEQVQSDFAPAYIESLIENTTENLKKSTSSIEQQNINQEKIMTTLSEMNQYLNKNISVNREIKEELKVLSKTIANTLKKN